MTPFNIQRVLVVGYGSIAQRHIRVIRHVIPDVVIAVLRHGECAEVVNAGIEFCYTDIDSAFEFKPEIAVVANPAPFHLDVAYKLAERGVHLLIEKPISDSSAGVSELISLCENNHVVLQVGYNLRYMPSLQKYREVLLSGVIGNPVSVRVEVGQFLPSWRPDKDYRQSVSANSILGGGVLLELSHELDYLRWMFGEIKWVQACLEKQSDLDIDVHDVAHLVMGVTDDDDINRIVISLNMDFVRHDTTRRCTAIGDKGSLEWDAVSGEVSIFEKGSQTGWKTIYSHQSDRDFTYISEWENFLNILSGKEKPMVAGLDALAVLKIIEASTRSNSSHTRQMVGGSS